MYIVDEQSAAGILVLQERIYNLFRKYYSAVSEQGVAQQKSLLQLLYTWMTNDDAGPLLDFIDHDKEIFAKEDYQIARSLKFVEPAANKTVLTYICYILNNYQTNPSMFFELAKLYIDQNFLLNDSRDEVITYANIMLFSVCITELNDYKHWFKGSSPGFSADFLKLFINYAQNLKNSVQPALVLSEKDMSALKDFKKSLDDFAKQNSIKTVRNFFMPWVKGNVENQRSNYRLLLNEDFRSSLLLSEEETQELFAKFTDIASTKYSLGMQIYFINRVFLHAIITSHLEPREEFTSLLDLITSNLLQDAPDVEVSWRKIANKSEYPRELITHMRSYLFMQANHALVANGQAQEFDNQFANFRRYLYEVPEETRVGNLASFDKEFWLSLNLLSRDMSFLEVQALIIRDKVYTIMDKHTTLDVLDRISNDEVQRLLLSNPLLLCTVIGEVCLRHPNKYIDRFLSLICKPQFAFLNQSLDVNYQNYLLLILYSFVLYCYRPQFRKWFQVFLENADKQKVQELLVSSEAALYLFILALGVLSANTKENWYLKWGHNLDWYSIIAQHPHVLYSFLFSQERANYKGLLCSLDILQNFRNFFSRFAEGFLHGYSDNKQQLRNRVITLSPLWRDRNSQQRLAMFLMLQVDVKYSAKAIAEFVKVVEHKELQSFILALHDAEKLDRNIDVSVAIEKLMSGIKDKLAVGYTDTRYFDSEFIVFLIKQIIRARNPESKANSLIAILSRTNVRSTVQDFESNTRSALKYGVDAKFFLSLLVISGSVALLAGIILLSISSGNVIAGATTLGGGAAALLSFGIYNASTSFAEDSSYANALSVQRGQP